MFKLSLKKEKVDEQKRIILNSLLKNPCKVTFTKKTTGQKREMICLGIYEDIPSNHLGLVFEEKNLNRIFVYDLEAEVDSKKSFYIESIESVEVLTKNDLSDSVKEMISLTPTININLQKTSLRGVTY